MVFTLFDGAAGNRMDILFSADCIFLLSTRDLVWITSVG